MTTPVVYGHLPDIMAVLAQIGIQFPDVEIIVWLQGGKITVGFPKGPEGDAAEAAWRLMGPSVEISAS